MKHYLTAAMALIFLSGCDPLGKIGVDWPAKDTPRPDPVVQDKPAADAVDENTPTPDVTKPADTPGLIGVTVASLGDPAHAGFWLETPLVQSAGKGRVSYEKSGRRVRVDLTPIDGPATAGSRLSMAAMRLLDAPLTGLAEVRVYID